MNISGFAMDASAIYDVQTGRTDNSLAGAISTVAFTRSYGDIAVYNSGQYGSELVVTMESSGYDFVMRIRNWRTPATSILTVLAGSSTSAGGPFGLGDIGTSSIAAPRGVAINSQGRALTTLPYDPAGSGYGYDIPIAFNIDNPSFSAPLGNGGSAAISSRGMTTDSKGGFLIATGQQGSVYTQDVPGVVILDANLSHPTSVALPYFDTMQDVAVSPNDSTLYMALPQTDLGVVPGTATGEVLAATYSPPQSQPSPGGAYLILGKVFDDKNGDGSQDNGEAGLAGWTVFDDTNTNGKFDGGEPSGQSDASGIFFLLVPLPPIVTLISAAQQAGWKQTEPDATLFKGGGYPIFSTSFDQYHILEIPLNFGIQQQIATISAMVYDDTNGDGSEDNGETGLAGWNVFLDANGNGVLDPGEHTAVTDSQGHYSFTVVPGDYTVYAAPRDGWAETQPGSDWSWHYYAKQVAAGSTTSGFNFGVQFTSARISGAVYGDQDASGTQDNGEHGLAGWTIFLDANGNGTLDTGETTTLTNAHGQYSFDVQSGKDYLIYVAPQNGWAETEPGSDWSWHYYANQVATGSSHTGFDFGVVAIVVSYSAPVDPSSAQNVASYVLIQPGKDEKYGSKDDRRVKIVSATYDSRTSSVALLPKGGKLAFSPTLQLRVVGSGIRDALGRMINNSRDATALLRKGGATISARAVAWPSVRGTSVVDDMLRSDRAKRALRLKRSVELRNLVDFDARPFR
jgi:hypothetical protein